jgi:hypothetical protein
VCLSISDDDVYHLGYPPLPKCGGSRLRR